MAAEFTPIDIPHSSDTADPPMSLSAVAEQDDCLSCTSCGMSLQYANILVGNLPLELSEVGKISGNVAVGWTPDDTTNPPSMAKWFNDGIPGSKMHKHAAVGLGHVFIHEPATMRRALQFIT